MLVAHWTFEVDSVNGRRVTDVSGGGMTAELDDGVAVIPGRTGGALNFDGTGRAVLSVGPQLVLNQFFGFTVAFSVRPEAPPDGSEWRAVLTKRVAEDDARALGFWLYPDAPRIRVQLFTSHGPEYVDSRRSVPAGTWTHLAFVVSPDGMFLYVDGQKDVALPLEHAVVIPMGPIVLGGDDGRPGFTGLIEDLRVYATGLGDEAVRALADG
ncbi:LamG domain-containing protein [Actinomadura flavalba]|uniref:LamG domain-containing protein n=1 Tax=Actinomadura flavalba TaxID=1120938 RepID=UPI0003A661B7|nr:LamG domain-containing protein [Actinomadura flavalba]